MDIDIDTCILLFRFLHMTPEHPYCFSRCIIGKTKIFLNYQFHIITLFSCVRSFDILSHSVGFPDIIY